MKALIRVTRKTEYASIVEMDREEFDRLTAALNGSRDQKSKSEHELNRMIDIHDWEDDELIDLEEFVEVDEH